MHSALGRALQRLESGTDSSGSRGRLARAIIQRAQTPLALQQASGNSVWTSPKRGVSRFTETLSSQLVPRRPETPLTPQQVSGNISWPRTKHSEYRSEETHAVATTRVLRGLPTRVVPFISSVLLRNAQHQQQHQQRQVLSLPKQTPRVVAWVFRDTAFSIPVHRETHTTQCCFLIPGFRNLSLHNLPRKRLLCSSIATRSAHRFRKTWLQLRCLAAFENQTRPMQRVSGTERNLNRPLLVQIELSSIEQQIFSLLLEVNTSYRLGCTLRVAGGWVRDKLLGICADQIDLDIALDNMLGREFAERVDAFLAERGQKQGSVHVIRVNPAQSKHLETARMRLFDHWIDFVNLRKESYAADSRIPSMAIGTPEEDAFRRDLTINTLFYNINTKQVEDWTRMGLTDLAAGLIRTPLPPLTTFLEDPLRALRAVRFASRFGFTVVPEVLEAASSPRVREALLSKVSRERIATELELMLGGPQPVMALSLLFDMGLAKCLFPLPPSIPESAYPDRWTELALTRVQRLERFGSVWLKEGIELWQQDGTRQMLLLGACLSPLFDISYVIKRDQRCSVVFYILHDALRVQQQKKKAILSMLSACNKIRTLVLQPLAWNERSCRVEVGLLIRSLGSWWQAALLLQLALDERLDSGASMASAAASTESTASETPIVQQYLVFRDKIKETGLDRACELQPLLDGHAVRRLLPGLPVGPLLGEIMEFQIEEQLANPALTPTECASLLQKRYQAYRENKRN